LRRVCPHCEHRDWYYVGGAIGPVQPQDVGKRVYLTHTSVIQVENTAQRDKRGS